MKLSARMRYTYSRVGGSNMSIGFTLFSHDGWWGRNFPKWFGCGRNLELYTHSHPYKDGYYICPICGKTVQPNMKDAISFMLPWTYICKPHPNQTKLEGLITCPVEGDDQSRQVQDC